MNPMFKMSGGVGALREGRVTSKIGGAVKRQYFWQIRKGGPENSTYKKLEGRGDLIERGI